MSSLGLINPLRKYLVNEAEISKPGHFSRFFREMSGMSVRDFKYQAGRYDDYV